MIFDLKMRYLVIGGGPPQAGKKSEPRGAKWHSVYRFGTPSERFPSFVTGSQAPPAPKKSLTEKYAKM